MNRDQNLFVPSSLSCDCSYLNETTMALHCLLLHDKTAIITTSSLGINVLTKAEVLDSKCGQRSLHTSLYWHKFLVFLAWFGRPCFCYSMLFHKYCCAYSLTWAQWHGCTELHSWVWVGQFPSRNRAVFFPSQTKLLQTLSRSAQCVRAPSSQVSGCGPMAHIIFSMQKRLLFLMAFCCAVSTQTQNPWLSVFLFLFLFSLFRYCVFWRTAAWAFLWAIRRGDLTFFSLCFWCFV